MKFSFGSPFTRLFRSRRPAPVRRRAERFHQPYLEDLEPRETPSCGSVYWPAPYNQTIAFPLPPPFSSVVGVCNANDSGNGSLRQAIIDVNNAAPGQYIIFVSIPTPLVLQTHTIHLLSPLPPIHNPVYLDAVSDQLDWDPVQQRPVVEVDGSGAGANANGLVFNGTGNLFRRMGNFVAGFVLNNFGGSAIIFQQGTHDTVADSYIGTNADGTQRSRLGNNIGITVRDGARKTIIGPGTLPYVGVRGVSISLPGNLISGNTQEGILLTTATSRHTLVLENMIGTDYTGRGPIPNRNDGIVINQGSSDNHIVDNLISGNTNAGVSVQDIATQRNEIVGNLIGTDITGSLPVPNRTGVEVNQALETTIGGDGFKPLPKEHRQISRGNVISGNTIGVSITNVQMDSGHNTKTAVVRNNFIGTDSAGGYAAGMGNLAGGIVLQNSSGVTIGSLNPMFPNIIAANGFQGILLTGNSSQNLIEGNFIGTDITGAVALTNGIGVYIQGGSFNTVGGTAPGAGNLLSGNNAAGVTVLFNSSIGNLIQGNIIGSDPSLTIAVPNGTGINVAQAATETTIGGLAFGAGNYIYYNTTYGVSISDQATGTQVLGNIINGNHSHGVSLARASANTIGGLAPGAGNIIANNDGDGVLVDTGSGNLIEANSITGNARLGIELINNGNLNQQAPRITSAATDPNQNITIVSGSLVGFPNASYIVDFYFNTNLDQAGFGEGQYYLGTLAVTTDASGIAPFSTIIDGTMAPSGAAPPGTFLTATATYMDALQNTYSTSEFSVAVRVATAGMSPGDGSGAGDASAAVTTSDITTLAQPLASTQDAQASAVVSLGSPAATPQYVSTGRQAGGLEQSQDTGAPVDHATGETARHQAVDAVFATPADGLLDGSLGESLVAAGRRHGGNR